MEYLCLFCQTLFVLGTVFLPTGERYLINGKTLYKKYLTITLVAQILCVITSIVFLFFQPIITLYILVLQIVVSALLKTTFSLIAKNKHLHELKKRIVENNLMNLSPKEIRNCLLEKYSQVYFIDEIEHCLSEINILEGHK